MKFFIFTAIPLTICGVFFAGVYAATQRQASFDFEKLDACARDNNVYRCVFVPQPATPPKVVVKQAELLPPPTKV